MKRLCILCLLCLLAVPLTAQALTTAPGDGTLSVKAASGFVSLAIRGVVIGQIHHGTVTIIDPSPNDGKPPVVWGYEARKDLSDTKSTYSGADIRFRIIGGFFRVKVTGTGTDLTIVGRGSITLGPSAALAAGSYSVDGTANRPFPDVVTVLQLGTGPAPGSGS